jgi:hypothetical protein
MTMDVLGQLESALAEIPENVGHALRFLGEKLEELAARMDRLEQGDTPDGP